VLTLEGPKEFNFGTMYQRSMGKHTWRVKNNGVTPVTLGRGQASCACTVAKFPGESDTYVLLPGRDVQLTLEWDTQGSEGEFAKTAAFPIEGVQDVSKLGLAIKGQVLASVLLSLPNRATNMTIGRIGVGEQIRGEFYIASPKKPDFKLLSASSSNDNAIVHVTPLIQVPIQAWTGGGYLVSYSSTACDQIGAFNHAVVLETDIQGQNSIAVNITGRVVGAITPTPERLVMRNIDRSVGATATCLVEVRNLPTASLALVSKPEGMACKLDRLEGNRRVFKLTVELPAGVNPGIVTGDIVISVVGSKESVKIPVLATIRGM